MTALIGLRENLSLSRVHVLVDLPEDRSTWLAVVSQVVQAGADLVQLRGQNLGKRKNLAELEKVSEQTFARCLVSIDGDLKAARKLGADVVLLTAEQATTTRQQARAHEFGLVGREVREAVELPRASGDADFLYVGTSDQSVSPADHDLIAAAALAHPLAPLRSPAAELGTAVGQSASLPWFATGVTPATVSQVLAAGAQRVVVPWAALDPAAPERDLKAVVAELNRVWQQRPLLVDDTPVGHRAPWEVDAEAEPSLPPTGQPLAEGGSR